MKEGEGTVLDNSCIMFMSNMWSGRKHDSTQVPILTAGGLGGTLETGRVLDYLQEGRREPQALQLLPVADGSHGRETQKIRRRGRRTARNVRLTQHETYT